MFIEDRLETDAKMGVTRHRYVPGDGRVYLAYVSKLPIAADGGGPKTHRLVTIIAPQQGAWVAPLGGYVTADFVSARLPGLGVLSVNRLVEMLAHALDAQPVIDREAEEEVLRG